ncbi:acyl dehydratase [Neobacillus bataviensis LMG 21833]|uniref:Acyl dehydratase n=1 Tax=Neobacillus bataviensis LMG 21833 TaxID=1117379 RepID=K6D365_9BACI|nr:MaoC family dehydratase [Neobacillus bataviensis]EKN66947.1 acyl dehydratase [Neobacillus bataviensis LMG 21833]
MTGLYYEDFEIGHIFSHKTGRTVYDYDNVLFSTLTMNPQPLHLDEEYSSRAEFGKPLMNSLFTLGLAIGLTVNDTTLGTTVGNLGFDKVEFPKPVFAGDTIYVETEVLNKRESKSRPKEGLVFLEHRARNQHEEIVMCCQRVALMRKKHN